MTENPNWLIETIKKACEEYEKIPEWKRERMREYLWAEEYQTNYNWHDAHPGGL